MASWMLGCTGCKRTFPHSKIEDSKAEDYFFPVKPTFPPEGLEMKCPHCGQMNSYQRSDLVYQA
jgi:DNA-directed RNA polymerase subunit RPC12/RpoP